MELFQSFKDMQAELFADFKQINKEFLEAGITWWAHSGTLLGFARDKGMIEWDDDIDMAMTYKDYYNFYHQIVAIADKYDYDVIDPIHNTGTDTVKLVKRQKRIVEWKEHASFFSPTIDIMLAIPNKHTSPLRGKIKSIPMNISFIFSSRVHFFPHYGWRGSKLFKIPRIYNYLLYPFKPLLWPISIPFVKCTFKKSLKKKDWTNVSMYYNYGHKGRIYNLTNMELMKVSDDLEVLVAKDWEKELELWFGDWKSLPPVEKQVPHHLLLYKIN